MKFRGLFIVIVFIFSVITISLKAQIKMLYDTEKSEKNRFDRYINSGYNNIQIFRIDLYESEGEADTSLVYKITISDDKNIVTEIDIVSESKTVVKLYGKITSREITDNSGQLVGKTLYTYNNEGIIIKRELYFGNIKALDEIYEFESRNNGEVKYYSADGTLISNSIFKFDGQNNLLEELKYNSMGEVEQKYEYTYDSKGRMIEERIILQNEQKTVTNYSYDENNNIIEEQTKDNNENILSYNKYAYEGDKLIEEISDSRDSKLRRLYSYKDGLLKSVKYLDLIDKSTYIWVYEYR